MVTRPPPAVAIVAALLAVSLAPLGHAGDVAFLDDRLAPLWLEFEAIPRSGQSGDVVVSYSYYVQSGSNDNFHHGIWLEAWVNGAYQPWRGSSLSSDDRYHAGAFIEASDAPAIATDVELVERPAPHQGNSYLAIRGLSVPVRFVIGAVPGPGNDVRIVTTVTADPGVDVTTPAKGDDTHEWVFHGSARAEARGGARIIGGGLRVEGHDSFTTHGRTYITSLASGSVCERTGPHAWWAQDWGPCDPTSVWAGAPGTYAIHTIAEAHAEADPNNILRVDNGLRDARDMLMIVDTGRP